MLNQENKRTSTIASITLEDPSLTDSGSTANISSIAESLPFTVMAPCLPDEAGTQQREAADTNCVDHKDMDEQIAAHLPMVRYLARRIHDRLPSHVEMDDLVSAGVVGLMDAYTKFKPSKKVLFRSYAQFRVRGAILDSLRNLDWSPRELRKKGRALEDAVQALTRKWARCPSEVEVAAELGVTLDQYQHLLGELKGLEIGTLNAERSEDSGEEEIAYLPNSPEDDPLFRCLKSEMHRRLVFAIEQLAERERLVLSLYYFDELTMREVGLSLGVVESRVSQIHSSAVLNLRALLMVDDLGQQRKHVRAKAKVRLPQEDIRSAEIPSAR